MAVNRLFEILCLLLDQGRVTAPELAERFEVSVRTIYRDIDALSAAGVPVYAAQGRKGGISLLDGYVLDRAYFTPEEQRRLLTALRSLPKETAGSRETLAKLSALFRQEAPDWLLVDLSGWGAGEGNGETFELLRRAIQHKHPISFRYLGSNAAAGQTRRVLPARLVFKSRAWYLQGFCLTREDYRTFKVGRMLELSVDPEPFGQMLSPPPIDLEEASALPFCVALRLRFAPWMAYRVYDEFAPSAIRAQEDGALLVEVTFPEDQWLYGYLLSFGAAVEVLEPDQIRTRLGLLAREIWLGTQNHDTGCQVFYDTIASVPGQQNKQEAFIMEEKFCQSCGMPLSPEMLGSESDGTSNPHYCQYCYQNGAFTGEMTMEEMIEFCVPHMVQAHPDMTAEQARGQMAQFFPLLMRWSKG